jgi:hypothetical protein
VLGPLGGGLVIEKSIVSSSEKKSRRLSQAFNQDPHRGERDFLNSAKALIVKNGEKEQGEGRKGA